jgi:YidC/Oxa1 family membrane protein insertase
MDMTAEKRTLIAIFLIVVISILSYRFLPRQERPVPQPAERQEPAPAETTLEESQIPEMKPLTAQPSSEERFVELETDSFRVTLTSVGAAMSSFVLKGFKDLSGGDSAPAELVPEGRRALVTTVRTNVARYDLSAQDFAVEEVSPATDSTPGYVLFSTSLPDGSILRKSYTLSGDDYMIKLTESYSGNASELRVDWAAGLRQTEKAQRGYLNYFSAMAMVGGIFKQWPLPKAVKTLRQGDPSKVRDLEYVANVDWAAVKTKYFMACFMPKKEVRYFRVDTVPYAEEEGSSNLSVTLGTEGSVSEYDVYIGPLQYDRLRSFGLGLERAVYLGPGWVSGISRFILRVLVWLHKLVRNYGVVIIIFSCMMMIVFYPLTFRSLRSMREMQKLQPKINALREKYKKDPQKINAEMMGIYKKEGINPLGGCLPLLFQMPVFWALFAILRSMIELRGAHFLWISDLSERDPFFILPVLMAGSMFVQQRFTPTDPRQKGMAYMMPIVMLFIFWSFPAGLVLYWFIYNVLSVVQHYLLHKRGEETKSAPA